MSGTHGLRKIHDDLRTAGEVELDPGLYEVMKPEYEAYVKSQKKSGKPIKSFNEWVNS